MTDTEPQRDSSTYDSDLIEDGIQYAESATPNGPLEPSRLRPIGIPLSYTL